MIGAEGRYSSILSMDPNKKERATLHIIEKEISQEGRGVGDVDWEGRAVRLSTILGGGKKHPSWGKLALTGQKERRIIPKLF